MTVIAFTKVSLPYGWLGNMAPHPVVIDGIRWRTAEHAFQANRFAPDHPVREMIRKEKSPMTAKMVVKRYREDMVIEPCSDQDVLLMRSILGWKMTTNPELGQMLRDTGDARIVEDCTKRQHGNGLFWGAARDPEADGGWRGQNVLGELWMNLRETL